ncbi:hypothetical protein [Halocatena marina]|uniref:hypothetical protein n=1 Tax=Halocatena marina TaxID=2934937 RepID=UPI0036F353E5
MVFPTALQLTVAVKALDSSGMSGTASTDTLFTSDDPDVPFVIVRSTDVRVTVKWFVIVPSETVVFVFADTTGSVTETPRYASEGMKRRQTLGDLMRQYQMLRFLPL